jgi:sialidase-1
MSHLTYPALGLAASLLFAPLRAESGNQLALDISSSPEHPRNSEGSFATLRSGRIAFYYTQFYGGASDYSSARIVEVHSDDQGRTWSQPVAFAEKGDSVNVMSVSLLRLASGKLAIFYVVKNSGLDCRPYLRVSADEGESWSAPRRVIAAPGYFVLNNDRVIQTRSGRILVPVAFNRLLRPVEYRPDGVDSRSNDLRGIILWYYSDDEGGELAGSHHLVGPTGAERGRIAGARPGGVGGRIALFLGPHRRG